MSTFSTLSSRSASLMATSAFDWLSPSTCTILYLPSTPPFSLIISIIILAPRQQFSEPAAEKGPEWSNSTPILMLWPCASARGSATLATASAPTTASASRMRECLIGAAFLVGGTPPHGSPRKVGVKVAHPFEDVHIAAIADTMGGRTGLPTMDEVRDAPTADALVAALLDARRVELELLDGLTDAQMLGAAQHFVEPPIWEMGHVGWFQEYWLLRHLDGAAPLLPGSDGIYDAFNVSYTLRWEHTFPTRPATLEYITEVLRRSAGRLESRTPAAADVYFYTLAAQHEDMHAENLTMILRTLGYPLPKLSLVDPAAVSPLVDGAYQSHDVAVPGGTFMLGAAPTEPFVFDNEKWAHEVTVAPFRIATTPVTNAEFAAFVDDGGYRRRELWSRRGWDWRRREGVERPLFWIHGGDGWYECH